VQLPAAQAAAGDEDDGGGGALSACLGTSLGVSAIALCEFWLAMTVRSHLTELVDGISLIVFQSCGTCIMRTINTRRSVSTRRDGNSSGFLPVFAVQCSTRSACKKK